MTRAEWAFLGCDILLLVLIALTWRTFLGGVLFGAIACAVVVRYGIAKTQAALR